jgi:cyclopropane fatty-acyl-phospholipid synthase-like methyltransferase
VTHPKAAERLVWAVETLDVKPTDRLLEIGCGHGVAVSLVCEKLDGGSITAIDRSPTMIAMARKRNADCVAAGRASFQTVSLHEADFGAAQFDKVFAIRVGVFLRGQPARELAVVKRCLAPDGRFYLVYDPPAAHQARNVIEQASATLENHGFTINKVLTHDVARTMVVCVIAGSTS